MKRLNIASLAGASGRFAVRGTQLRRWGSYG